MPQHARKVTMSSARWRRDGIRTIKVLRSGGDVGDTEVTCEEDNEEDKMRVGRRGHVRKENLKAGEGGVQRVNRNIRPC